jgi:hypothetical protein
VKTKLIWAGALALAVVMGLLLVLTEGRYIQFITSLSEVTTQVVWAKSEAKPDETLLTFNVLFHNTSPLPLWVEVINTQLTIAGDFAGTYTTTEGNYRVSPGETGTIPLEVPLWSYRDKMLADAKSHGAELHLEGQARVHIGLHQAESKIFYPVVGTFSLKDDHGL